MLSQFYITIDGQQLGAAFTRAVERVSVENSLHLPDMATIELHDPTLAWIDDEHLAPGKAMKISASASEEDGLLFDGEIVELEPTFAENMPRLLVRAFDRLHRLDRGTQIRSFIEITDGDLIEKLAKEAGLKCKVGPTPQVHPYLLQTNESNLQFLQRRAAALGYLLYVEGETLHCVPPESEKSPIEIAWGTELIEFRPRLTTLGQVNRVSVRGWDPQNKEVVLGEARKPRGAPLVGNKKNGGETATEAFHIEAAYTIVDTPLREQAAAERLAQATMDRIGGQFIEAEGLTMAAPGLVAGAAVKISGVGTRFGGQYFVTATTHSYDTTEGYQVQFHISGLHPTTLLSLLAPPQKRLQIDGLVVGIVTDNDDELGQGRVKLKFPWLSNEHASNWARVIAPGAGDERGIQFLPEINDEVLVGFEMGDPNLPYVLGGLWNGKDRLAMDGTLKNGDVLKRVIRSRNGHQIVFDDSGDAPHITLSDKEGNTISIDKQQITISDAGGNTVTLDGGKSSITVKSAGNLALEAQGNIDIKGNGQVTIKGATINLN